MANDEGRGNRALPKHLRDLSYEIHTNRELEFMLKGIKPLAYFSDLIFDDSDMWEPDEAFEWQVELGTFVKHEVRELCEPYTHNGHLIKGEWSRFYALKDEAWRIPAFLLLKKLMKRHPWSDAFERMEGTLLGYTDEQNDEWLERRRQRHAGWQCVTLYATAPRQVLSEIEQLGKRAFPKGSLPNLRLFMVERIPDRGALEQAELLSPNFHCQLIRFGVLHQFFKEYLELIPGTGIAHASFRPGVEVQDLNEALRTEIQVLKLE